MFRTSRYELVERFGGLAGFDRGAVIDERLHRHARDELGHAAHVVPVIVRHDEVVDLRQARALDRGRNAIGVAAVEAGPSGVDEHRLAGGRHDQRRLSAFDVDDVDVERIGRLSGDGRHAEKDGDHTVLHKLSVSGCCSSGRRTR